MKVAIHQPNFLPWLGYFRKMAQVDTFIYLDTAQLSNGKTYTSRTQLLTANGFQWLTIPVEHETPPPRIADATLVLPVDVADIMRTLTTAYPKRPWTAALLEECECILSCPWTHLAALNIALIEWMGRVVEARPTCVRASSLLPTPDIPALLAAVGTTDYYTGTGEGTLRYLASWDLAANGITVHPIMTTALINGCSMLDTLLRCGPEETRALVHHA